MPRNTVGRRSVVLTPVDCIQTTGIYRYTHIGIHRRRQTGRLLVLLMWCLCVRLGIIGEPLSLFDPVTLISLEIDEHAEDEYVVHS